MPLELLHGDCLGVCGDYLGVDIGPILCGHWIGGWWSCNKMPWHYTFICKEIKWHIIWYHTIAYTLKLKLETSKFWFLSRGNVQVKPQVFQAPSPSLSESTSAGTRIQKLFRMVRSGQTWALQKIVCSWVGATATVDASEVFGDFTVWDVSSPAKNERNYQKSWVKLPEISNSQFTTRTFHGSIPGEFHGSIHEIWGRLLLATLHPKSTIATTKSWGKVWESSLIYLISINKLR